MIEGEDTLFDGTENSLEGVEIAFVDAEEFESEGLPNGVFSTGTEAAVEEDLDDMMK